MVTPRFGTNIHFGHGYFFLSNSIYPEILSMVAIIRFFLVVRPSERPRRDFIL
jgi:hypothetical protein